MISCSICSKVLPQYQYCDGIIGLYAPSIRLITSFLLLFSLTPRTTRAILLDRQEAHIYRPRVPSRHFGHTTYLRNTHSLSKSYLSSSLSRINRIIDCYTNQLSISGNAIETTPDGQVLELAEYISDQKRVLYEGITFEASSKKDPSSTS